MITTRLTYLIFVVAYLASLIGGCIYRLDLQTRRLCTTPYLRLRVLFVYIVWIIYLTFLGLQAIRFKYISKNIDKFNIVIAYFFAFLPPFPFTTILLVKTHEICALYNATLELIETVTSKDSFLSKKDLEKDRQMSKHLEKFLVLLGLGCGGAGTLVGGHFLIFPHWPMYYTSLWYSSPPWETNDRVYQLTYLWYSGFHLVFLWNLWAYVGFAFGAAAVYLSHVVPLLKQTFTFNRRHGNKLVKGTSFYRLVQRQAFFTTYATIDILHNWWMDVIGVVFAINQLIIGKVIMTTLVVLLKYSQNLDWRTIMIMVVWGQCGWGIWSTTLDLMGRFHTLATKTVNSWKYVDWGCRKENLAMARFKLSCRPLSVHFGRVFVAKKTSMLAFNKGILRGTFRVLMALKKSRNAP